MTSLTTNKSFIKPGHNEDVDTWDVPVNTNSDSLDACLGNVTFVNMTGRSSYTLTSSDILATTIIFQNTLNSGAIPVKMPNGTGGQFTLIDSTTKTDATSQISMGWTSGGTSCLLGRGATQPMTADGVNLVWYTAAAQAISGVTYMDLTGLTGRITISEDRCRNKTWVFTGTLVNNALFLDFPQSSAGVYGQVHLWSAAGGGSNLVLDVAGTSGTGTFVISANTAFMAGYYRLTETSSSWAWRKFNT